MASALSSVPRKKYTAKLHDKRILILGGTSGIGFCVAEVCLEFGYASITISSSQQAKVDSAISRLTSYYPEANNNGMAKLDHIVYTVGNRLSMPRLADIMPELVYKAGIVRYSGSLIIAKLIASGTYVHSSPSSSFTMTGGTMASKPPPGSFNITGWSATKGGLTRALAVELKPIRVNSVAPSFVHIEMVEGTLGGDEEK